MKEKTIIVLRWVSVLPAAVIAYLLSYWLLLILNWLSVRLYFSSDSDGGWMSLYVWPVIAYGVAGYYFVSFGSYAAPSNKNTVKLILMILATLISGASLVWLIRMQQYGEIVGAIAQIVGAVIAFKNDED